MSHDTLFGHFFFYLIGLCWDFWLSIFMGFVYGCLYIVCVYLYFYGFSFLCMFLCFLFLLVGLFQLLVHFLKTKRKKAWSLMAGEVWRIWEDMREGKLWSEYIVWKKFTFHFKKIVSILFRKKRFFYCLVHKY